MKTLRFFCALAVSLLASLSVWAMTAEMDRGQYLLIVGGCNDCHSPGYAESGGKLPVDQWLTGSPVGYQGPWGVTYAPNLRLLMQSISEDQWLERARMPMRPPMPSPALNVMTDEDLKSLYRFIRNLGGLGESAPAYLAPGEAIATPYFEFVPKNPPSVAQP